MSRPERAPRVLLVSPQPFFEERGTPLRVLQMVRSLCAGGAEVHLASYHLGSAVAIEGLVHRRAPRVPGVRRVAVGFSWRKLVLDAVLALHVWRILLGRRFDVVHCVEESIFFVLPLARLRGIPAIFDLNSSVAHQLEYGGTISRRPLVALARAIQAAALRGSKLAITVGRALTEEGVRSLGSTIPVAEIEDCPVGPIDASVDPLALASLRRGLGLEDHPVVVYTGNLAGYQGVDLLLDAVPVLLRRRPDARVLIVGGEATQIAAMKAMLAERGHAGAVLFAGQQPASRMRTWMALGDLLVSPRRGGRNTPLKLYSYMASGVPIVATDLPTHTQVLDPDTAVLCVPTPEALGTAMADVLDAPATYESLAANARRRVEEQYSPAAFQRKLLDAYARLLGGATFSSSATSMYPRVHATSASSAANARIAG